VNEKSTGALESLLAKGVGIGLGLCSDVIPEWPAGWSWAIRSCELSSPTPDAFPNVLLESPLDLIRLRKSTHCFVREPGINLLANVDAVPKIHP
jgi:hypothetical protein